MDFNVKEVVKDRYGSIASEVMKGKPASCCATSCCGTGGDSEANKAIIYDGMDLSKLPKEAINASLGCGNPFLFAGLKEGEQVLDLGSGGGIDVLVAAKYVGDTGKVYGLDMTDEMLALANKNKEAMGVANVEFIKGYIEDIPLPDHTVDVVMSNCVVNLSEDKEKTLGEAYRVLKEGGRLAISDVVTLKDVAPEIRRQAEMWCGCFAGTLKAEEYERILKKVGFRNISIEIAHVYTKSVLQDMLGANPQLAQLVGDVDLGQVDGAFASAYIRGVK